MRAHSSSASPTDSALKARLDALRGADAATRRLFAAVDAAPMPDSVLQLLAKAKNAETAPQRSNVLAFPARGLRQFWQTPVAIAASVALAVGFMASQLVQQAAGPDTGLGTLGARSIDAGSGLYALLEDQASGQVARLGDAVSGQAVLTFTDQAGRYCRQLRLDAAAASAHAVACRAAGRLADRGRWPIPKPCRKASSRRRQAARRPASARPSTA